HSSASLARNVGRRLYRILRPRDSLGLLEISGEWIVKVADGLHPGFIAFLNLIELCFELRGEIDIDDVRKSLQQEIIDRAACFGWQESAIYLLHILAFLNGRDDRRVGRGTPNTFLFQLLNQQRFIVAWRRLGEVLLRGDSRDRLLSLFHEPEPLAFGQFRKLP